MNFSQWVVQTREAQKLSQTECALRAGIRQPSWQEYEAVNRPRARKTVEKIADALGVKRAEALEAAGYATEPPDVPAEVVSYWQRAVRAGKETEMLKAWRATADLVASV